MICGSEFGNLRFYWVALDGARISRAKLRYATGCPRTGAAVLWSDTTGREARLFFGGAREAGWDCNLICFQTIQPETGRE